MLKNLQKNIRTAKIKNQPHFERPNWKFSPFKTNDINALTNRAIVITKLEKSNWYNDNPKK